MASQDPVKHLVLQTMALQQLFHFKELPDLLSYLQAAGVTEINSESLASLAVEQLKSAELPIAQAELAELDWPAIESVLQGQLPDYLIAPETLAEKNASALRCAVASTDGLKIDGHFGKARVMFVFDVAPTDVTLVDIRLCDPNAEDKNQARADQIRDCQLLFVAAIGGPAAARVIRADIYPMKVKAEPSIEMTLTNLQSRLGSDRLPPWLMRILGKKPTSMNHLELDLQE